MREVQTGVGHAVEVGGGLRLIVPHEVTRARIGGCWKRNLEPALRVLGTPIHPVVLDAVESGVVQFGECPVFDKAFGLFDGAAIGQRLPDLSLDATHRLGDAHRRQLSEKSSRQHLENQGRVRGRTASDGAVTRGGTGAGTSSRLRFLSTRPLSKGLACACRSRANRSLRSLTAPHVNQMPVTTATTMGAPMAVTRQ